MAKVAYKITMISAVLIARDAAQTLRLTLDSLKDFRDVIVYDNGSTDNSCEIARQFPNVTLVEGPFLGYGATKNLAASHASNDTVLSLDADEVLTPSLANEIAVLQHLWQRSWVGRIKRLNYFLGKAIHFGDWRNDRVLRIYDRREHAFCLRSVHESIQLRRGFTEVKRLSGRLNHNTVTDLGQSIQKIDRYSELNAQEQHQAGRKGLHPLLCWLKANFAFVRCYLLRLGFLDGWRGLVIAYGVAVGVFYKYGKIYALNAAHKSLVDLNGEVVEVPDCDRSDHLKIQSATLEHRRVNLEKIESSTAMEAILDLNAESTAAEKDESKQDPALKAS